MFDSYHNSVFSHPLFRSLKLREKEGLKEFYIIQEYLKGERILFEGDILESLYLVLEGSVSHLNEKNGSHSYFTGDFWGMEAILHPCQENGSYRAREDTIILRLRSEGFRRFLKQFPQSRYGLKPRIDKEGHLLSGFPESLWKDLGKNKSELVYRGRTSKKSFSLFLLLPLSFCVTGLLLAQISPWMILISLAGLILAGCELFLRSMILYSVSEKTAVRRFFNWRNFRLDQEEVPLDQVKSVHINVKGVVRQILNMGDLSIQTAGKGLLFKNIDDPKGLQKKLMELKSRRDFEQQGEQREEFRKLVRQNLMENVAEHYAGSQSRRKGEPLPQRRVFRKSPAILIFQLFIPFSLLTLSFFPSLLLSEGPGRGLSLFFWIIRGALLLRALWISLDWWNDIYKIELPFIWDIERKPFGSEEVRTQTDLAGVLNVRVSQKGLIRLILNYGDVIIETPGNSGTLEFYSVWNPMMVQSEIFQYRSQILLNKEKNQQVQSMKQFGEFAQILKQVQGHPSSVMHG
ncbi:cyclic nucleotide-binding domain-containing protein [Oceanispirochaeta crateris]|uniref:Cyclic nucleotide-binding domain-containing protein n=1 Tax=Oceanispirochaeta crateris TaxID=2518645 RepID=A0A5C1QMB9_9SPIO|nr:cyclic nucleotide-binding domain-containing protein [Oceanispirochaeta crateris]QEN09245.1 cyclic nucleotide-binding domain-containing protein [Oceanispirochaeta crateris]